MLNPTLIVISGAPGTGKSTLASRLAKQFALPCLTKDDIKERLFDTLGWSDRVWSQRLGAVSNELLLHMAQQMMITQTHFILESSFWAEMSRPQWAKLVQRYHYAPLEIHCMALPETLARRFRERAPNRHAGHVDNVAHDAVMKQIRCGVYAPLRLSAAVVEVDTTDFARVNYTAIEEMVRARLERPQGTQKTPR
ncbi:MAG: ATP-binding protein [Chloroflexi bacterium]|nr:ATP-binding protein [Chloroflexota bacterium]